MGSRLKIGVPFVISRAAPLADVMTAIVTIKSGRLHRVISEPASVPNVTPISAARTAAAGIGTPACSRSATETPESATTDPTERSMPPTMTTNVMPIAMMPGIAERCHRLMTFCSSRKLGERIDAITIKTISSKKRL